MTAPLFYVDEVDDSGSVVLRGDEARHLSSAMRITVGESVLVGDGRGRLARCVVHGVHRGEIVLAIAGVDDLPPARALTVVQAVPKGERGDLAVELLTEAGVSEIVPWQSMRTVSDWR
ncbi:MAG: 16S rRNA (uracil(1498)-N(3))-methyltransferase, partial [Actinobacteria bacterium]|nr:16S rRNA (uracil(1498)-N(3))-methyltransferase [Actinomycetota bacterium]